MIRLSLASPGDSVYACDLGGSGTLFVIRFELRDIRLEDLLNAEGPRFGTTGSRSGHTCTCGCTCDAGTGCTLLCTCIFCWTGLCDTGVVTCAGRALSLALR